ncbi:MAG: tetratricopeptide repeat protein [Alistipes indistinctus]
MKHMTAGDYETALKGLETQRDNPAAQNYIGVCFMMKGDYDQAETFLRKAEKMETNTHRSTSNISAKPNGSNSKVRPEISTSA